MGHIRLYVYRKPNVIKKHEYTDDVAITYANSLEEAKEKFDVLYALEPSDDIEEIYFNDFGVAILTDY